MLVNGDMLKLERGFGSDALDCIWAFSDRRVVIRRMPG